MWWWVYQIIYLVIVAVLMAFASESMRTLIIEIGIMFIWLSALLCSMLQELHDLKRVIECERCNRGCVQQGSEC